MSTSAQTCQPKIKKSKYKLASPISNDRAEAFIGPLADILPKFAEIPSERDAKAFLLASKGMTQREIAKSLRCSQPTVQRTLKKYRGWFGSTLPEDRGELIGFPRFRVAVEEHRTLLRHQIEMAMEEWQQSRQPIAMKRKRTKIYPEGRKANGAKVEEVIIDEYVQRRNPSASHLNAAAKRSLELTMLEAGYLGVRQLSCDEAIDVDERDRWDRLVKSHQKTNEELKREVAELKAQLAAMRPGSGVFGMSDSPSLSTPQPKTPDPLARHNQTMLDAGHIVMGSEPRAELHVLDESRIASPSSQVNQTSLDSEVASPVQKATSGERPDSCPADFQSVNQVNQEPQIPCSQTEPGNEGTGINRSATSGGRESLAAKVKEEGKSGTLKTPDPGPPPEPKYRWEDSFRQEALDYHCLKFGLPPATTDMATGIPDPFKMSPRLWIERGYPYQIFIDRDIPCTRRNPLDTMGVIKLKSPVAVHPEGW